MNTKLASLALGIGLIGAAASHASVTFQVNADQLKDAFGGAMSQTGSVFLIADTANDSFGQGAEFSLSAGLGYQASAPTFFDGPSGNDLILWRSDLTTNGLDGLFLDSMTGIVTGLFGGHSLDVGDALALVWMPDFTGADTDVSAGLSYGLFTSAAPVSGGDAWVMPTDGDYILNMFSQDSLFLPFGPSTGDLDSGLFEANLTIADPTVMVPVPEPAAGPALAGALLAGFALWQRRRKAARK